MSIGHRCKWSRHLAIILTTVTAFIVSLVDMTLPTSQAAAAPTSIYCASGRDTRQAVLLVHGFNSGPQTWGEVGRKQLAAAGSATCIDVFDYADRSTHWVTDNKIGPALATRIKALAAASKAGNGSGKVIVVAHSMGGLATRCAASSTCNGGHADIATHIAELITFGTPNNGSWLVGPGLKNLGRTLGSLLSATCYLSFNGANEICVAIRALGTSDATRAFNPDSDQLKALPQLPREVPVYALAGQVQIHSSFFGLNDVYLGDGGDTLVLQDSAQAVARKIDGIGGSQTITCGKIDITAILRSTNSCWHSSETNDTRFLGAAAHQIALVDKKLNVSTLTSSQVLNSVMPPESCGDGRTFGWKQPVSIQLRNGTGIARFPDNSFAGSTMDDVKVLGFSDIDGNGHRDVVVQYTCYGSTPEQCCAGRSSHAGFVRALAIGRSGKLHPIGAVIRSGFSLPGDEYGPAFRNIKSATLVGTTVTTYEYIVYNEKYTPAQVGGDPTALVAVKHKYSAGSWTSS